MNRLCGALCAILLAACSLGAQKDAPVTFDFGAPHANSGAQKTISRTVLVHGIAAPVWLDTQAIVYRLNYQDGARQLSYANSRWAAPPAALLTQRLRGEIAAVSSAGIVSVADSARLELEDFSQVFDAADRSRVVVSARASIVNVGKRALLAQKNFSFERPAGSANAEGGVRALAAAGDELIGAVVTWTAASLAADK